MFDSSTKPMLMLSPCQNSQGWWRLQHPNGARCICLIASAGNPGEDQFSSCQGMPFVSISRGVGMLHPSRGSDRAQMVGWESSRCACDPRCWWRGRGGKHIMHAFHLWDTLFMCQCVCISNNQIYVYICTSIAARGGGGSFKREKIYNSEEHVPIESFVTTLIHWTFFLMTRTKLAFVGFVAAGNSMWHQVLDDLCLVVTDQSATTCDSSYAPNSTQYNSVLQSSEKCYPSTILNYKVLLQKVLLQYYKVLIQYYSVLQSTSPVLLRTTKYYSCTTSYYKVLLRTTKYYSSTTPYYKVLLQYYFVLQSTSPVLLRTTKYYSSTTPYYKVLLQYYFVLQSTTPVLQTTTPVLLRTTKYYSSTTVLLRTTKYYSSTTPYYKVLLQYYKVLVQYYSSTTKY